ncbi:MAG TPA: putative toxin-antitoxin system toxin component, PIN family [Spirochaetia bacterium]|nr:putative toxin-antitoxin system toxin component, PIN family [Spirochaetia bacterium]
MKAVLDTNILVSVLIGKALGKLESMIKEKRFSLLTSTEQMDELLHVANRAKFSRYYNDYEKKVFLRMMKRFAEKVEIKRKVDACRDDADNFILDIAVNGQADFIITRDKDLLELNPFEGIEILTFQEFEKKL